jgi:hypothetical protein
MAFWRRHFSATVRLAIGLLLATFVPTLSRVLVALDPVRTAMIAEVCSVRMAPTASAQEIRWSDLAVPGTLVPSAN